MAAIPRATIAEALLRALTPGEEIVLTHLVVWLLVLVSGVFLALRFYAIWQRSLVLVLDDGLLAASLVSSFLPCPDVVRVTFFPSFLEEMLTPRFASGCPGLQRSSNLHISRPQHRLFVLRTIIRPRHHCLGAASLGQCHPHRIDHRLGLE